MNKKDQINKAIERKREEMHQASDRYGLTSLMVLQKSRELDMLLNDYVHDPKTKPPKQAERNR